MNELLEFEWDIAILSLRYFGWKMPIPANLGVWGFDPLNYDEIILTPKDILFRGTTRSGILGMKIG